MGWRGRERERERETKIEVTSMPANVCVYTFTRMQIQCVLKTGRDCE